MSHVLVCIAIDLTLTKRLFPSPFKDFLIIIESEADRFI